jgi:hypothetical protein
LLIGAGLFFTVEAVSSRLATTSIFSFELAPEEIDLSVRLGTRMRYRDAPLQK